MFTGLVFQPGVHNCRHKASQELSTSWRVTFNLQADVANVPRSERRIRRVAEAEISQLGGPPEAVSDEPEDDLASVADELLVF